MAAKIIEQNKNMLALKARQPFDNISSVSALESSGNMHTFIIKYQSNPAELVIDLKGKEVTVNEPAKYQSKTVQMINDAKSSRSETGRGSTVGGSSNASMWKSGDTPLLRDVANMPQRLYHIYSKEYDVQALCEDISAYNDITYITLSIRNKSGISYDINDATFVIESKKKGKRTVVYDKTVFPRSRYGSLSSSPGGYSRMVYSFDKMTLSRDQVLKVYFYEQGGQRNLVITLDTKDINRARVTDVN
jgi:hypothetical protein